MEGEVEYSLCAPGNRAGKENRSPQKNMSATRDAGESAIPFRTKMEVRILQGRVEFAFSRAVCRNADPSPRRRRAGSAPNGRGTASRVFPHPDRGKGKGRTQNREPRRRQWGIPNATCQIPDEHGAARVRAPRELGRRWRGPKSQNYTEVAGSQRTQRRTRNTARDAKNLGNRSTGGYHAEETPMRESRVS